jgi:hypothetical protein
MIKQNKKAFIDQIMLGFILFSTLIVLGTTVADNHLAREKYYSLDGLAKKLTRALSKHYLYHEDMSEAQNIANSILTETKTGQEILESKLVSYMWRDLDGDLLPDVVTTSISNYKQENFWFKFLDKDSFNIAEVNASEYVIKEEAPITSILLKYGGSNAGYHNVIGTYELDENSCIQNPRLVLVNKEEHIIGEELATYTNIDTRFFIIPDGYDVFGNRSIDLDSSVSISACEPNIPSVTIDGISNAGDVYFQDTIFNTDDGYDHMHEVAKSYFDLYEEFISTPITYCTRYKRNGSCKKWSSIDPTWEDWVSYAQENSIDYENDPNDEYIVTMEDLPNGGDKDFNDINLDTTKIRTPNTVETVEITDATDVSPLG